MPETKTEQAEATSIHQLVHEIIGGNVRRNTFTQWELELLLDLQTCGIRKSSRGETLRRYLKAVQQNFAQGSMSPLRLSAFLEQENQRSGVMTSAAALKTLENKNLADPMRLSAVLDHENQRSRAGAGATVPRPVEVTVGA